MFITGVDYHPSFQEIAFLAPEGRLQTVAQTAR
jgi:hypothetical protein